RRARRRAALGEVLPPRRHELRVVLAVPHPDRPARRRAGRAGGAGRDQPDEGDRVAGTNLAAPARRPSPEPCTMTGRSTLACLIVTLSTALIVPDVVAQHIAEGGAGLYFGNTSGLNGPVLFVRHLQPTGRGTAVGLRLEFRDDDGGGGRPEARPAEFEAILALGGSGTVVHVPRAVGLEGLMGADCLAPA